MTRPKISVLMCVYNGAPYLNEAIESILDQTFTDFELVIVDDATNLTFSFILKRKSDLASRTIQVLLDLSDYGYDVQYIRCDNAGENRALQEECRKHPKLRSIQFEFTPNNK